jgi:hypothetical protein
VPLLFNRFTVSADSNVKEIIILVSQAEIGEKAPELYDLIPYSRDFCNITLHKCWEIADSETSY